MSQTSHVRLSVRPLNADILETIKASSLGLGMQIHSFLRSAS